MFVAEHGANTVIERADLAGENRKTIITSVSKVPDIVVDTEEERIYWIDIGRNALETAKYDGTDRRLVRRSTNIYIMMSGLTLYKVWQLLFMGAKHLNTSKIYKENLKYLLQLIAVLNLDLSNFIFMKKNLNCLLDILFQDVVCLTKFQENEVLCLDKRSGSVVWSTTFATQQPWSVEVYDKDLQKRVPRTSPLKIYHTIKIL